MCPPCIQVYDLCVLYDDDGSAREGCGEGWVVRSLPLKALLYTKPKNGYK